MTSTKIIFVFLMFYGNQNKWSCVLTQWKRQFKSQHLFTKAFFFLFLWVTYYIPFYTLFLADFLEEHRRVLESRLQPVVREITDSRARTREELESLYRKIVSAVLLRSGLGSPTDIAVVREATGTLTEYFIVDTVCVYQKYHVNETLKLWIRTIYFA